MQVYAAAEEEFDRHRLPDGLQKAPEFLAETPLVYYILQEASAGEDEGNRLGMVGSYIVGATVAASLLLAADSEIGIDCMRAGDIRTLAAMLALHDPDRTSDDELKRLLG